MYCQPFVENAIVHGLWQHGQKGLITVRIEKQLDNLRCMSHGTAWQFRSIARCHTS
jgi:sensor histidine kinase YesM